MDDATLQEQYPAVVVAYDFVLPSYQMLLGRFESADNRIASLITTASSLTLAAPILARAVRPDIKFSALFVVALVLFGMSIVVGLFARMTGVLTLPDPGIIRQRSLSKSPWQFKSDAIFLAARHFDANATAINTKGNWAIVLTILMVLEIVSLALWIAL